MLKRTDAIAAWTPTLGAGPVIALRAAVRSSGGAV
jgi:hypothetical protein